MKLKTYPNVYWKDVNGKVPLKFIHAYGTTYEFQYDENGDIILTQI